MRLEFGGSRTMILDTSFQTIEFPGMRMQYKGWFLNGMKYV